MVVRTNTLWIGELVGQLLAILINTASVLFLLPYFFGLGAAGAAFLNLVYLFFGVITLINVVAIGWQWRRTQQRLDTINAQPGQWLAHWQAAQYTARPAPTVAHECDWGQSNELMRKPPVKIKEDRAIGKTRLCRNKP
ncbi:MAG: hypothetical protein ACOYNY_23210 [Caldilineaceae bacterium]